MNLEEALLEKHSKIQTELISAYIGHRQNRFDQLMTFVLGEDETLARRAAWSMSHAAERHPELIESHLPALIKKVASRSGHAAIRRNTAKLLQTVPLPENLLGEIFDVSIDLLNDPNEPVAPKAYSMTVLSRICQREPELIDEVVLVIEQHLPHGSAAYQARAKRVLAELAKS